MAFKGARTAFLGVRNALHSSVAMKVALFGVLFIPVIFSGFYLAAFYDPYSNLHNVAVAVVNEDKGAVISGEERNIGDEVCDRLDEEDQRFGWNYVSAKKAQEGLESGDYYMVCTIPKDFSANVASADSNNPTEAKLDVQYNKGKNMLASQIGATAWAKVESSLNENIIKEYWATVFDALKDSGRELQTAADGAGDLSEGLVDAVDGAGKIADGAANAESGSAQVTDGLTSAKEGSQNLDAGLGSAVDGADQVDQGAKSLASGSAELNEGLGALNEGAQTLEQGTSDLKDGIDAAAAGSGQLLSGAQKLQAGIEQFTSSVSGALDQASSSASQLAQAAGGASQYASAVSSAVDGMKKMELEDGTVVYVIDAASYQNLAGAAYQAADLSSKTASGMTQLNDALAENVASGSKLDVASSQLNAGASDLVSGLENLDGGLAAAQSGAADLNAGAGSLSAGVANAASGSEKVASGASALSEGTAQLSSGLTSAKDGSESLTSGLTKLEDGSSTLTSGLGTLRSGADSLSSGLVSAKDGAAELQSGLDDGAAKLEENGSNGEVKSAVMSAPVTLSESDYTSVKNYGTGFAPFFIGLGIWVGCIFAGFLIKPLNRRLLLSGASPVKVAFSGFMPLALYAIAQGILSVAFVQFGLGVAIDNVPAYYGMSILCCLCFTAIMQFLVAAFGFPGRFIAVVLLTLQLTSAAGTFPVETAPMFFQVLSPFMPMTYFVDGMRQIMAGGSAAAVCFDATALLIFLVVAFICTCLYARSKRTVLMSDLHPLLDL